jgi:hypothetical protein
MRGMFEEGAPACEPGVFLNGFYEHRPISYGERAYGFPHLGQSILNYPDGTILSLFVDDEPPPRRLHEPVLPALFRIDDGLAEGQVCVWTPDGSLDVIQAAKPRERQKCHVHKYAEGELGGGQKLPFPWSSRRAQSARAKSFDVP